MTLLLKLLLKMLLLLRRRSIVWKGLACAPAGLAVALVGFVWLGCAPSPEQITAPMPQEAPPKAGEFQAPSPNAEGGGDACFGPNKALPKDPSVYYGTHMPTHVPLSQGQIMAIGTFWGCSGTLITPTWVLSATHCGLSTWNEFCIGHSATNPNVCLSAKRVLEHPWADLTLMELTVDARTKLAGVEPIPLLGDDLDNSWIGRTAEASGYGQQETGASGEREFTAEPIAYLGNSTLTINGQGKHGVCFGDSGGPVMVIADDGSARVAGALSNGDNSCVGYDNYTRVDAVRSWIEGYIGVIQPAGPVPCGATTATGRCDGGVASWCGADGSLKTATCGSDERCSWSNPESGWRCVTEAQDACLGLSYQGACDGNVLRWCDTGGLMMRDCGACGETCVPNDESGFRCVSSSCGDLTFLGECDGNVAQWCNRSGEIETRDCAQHGQGCGWVNSESGFYCVPGTTPVQAGSELCAELNYHGRCSGAVAEWCDGGVFKTKDCAQTGETCGWTGDQLGYFCTAVDECGDLTYTGFCDGDTAQWCEAGKIETRDCAAQGNVCGWSGGDKGYDCIAPPAPACQGLDYFGECAGPVARWCKDGEVLTRDCSQYGQQCGWVDGDKGFYCQG